MAWTKQDLAQFKKPGKKCITTSHKYKISRFHYRLSNASGVTQYIQQNHIKSSTRTKLSIYLKLPFNDNFCIKVLNVANQSDETDIKSSKTTEFLLSSSNNKLITHYWKNSN